MKLSIITINLNDSSGLNKTIRSVISQTHNNFEYIVIDGGSADNSIEVIKSNSDKIDYWMSEPDKGIYHAMNKGIQQAHGEYCFFLNSGDYFVDEKVLENVFNNELHEEVVFGNLLVCLNGKLVGKSMGKEKLTFLDIYGSSIKHQATFIRRELFEKFGLYNEDLRILGDWEFFLKTVGLEEISYRYLNIDISYFDNNGISNKSGDLIEKERKIVVDKYIPTRMQPDYEFLLKYSKFEILTKYQITYFLLRIMTKGIKLFENIVYRR